MKFRAVNVLCAVVVGICSSIAFAFDPSPDELLNGAISTWRSGDVAAAREQFSAIIERGSDDPRVFYYRGILAEQSGESGDKDFKVGAKLEAERSAGTQVNRSLERTQGPLRGKIEKFRADARNELKADPVAARQKTMYREALDARAEGDFATALKKLESITEKGNDPRFFYMYGVTLAETGDLEKAKAAFAEGLQREKTTEDIELVSTALADVQGDIRRLIEEENAVEVGDQLVTRQKNQREVLRRAMMTENELLAEANLSSIAAEKQAEAEREARKLAAANEIMAEKLAREQLDAKLLDPPPVAETPAEIPVASVDTADAKEMPADPDSPTSPTEEPALSDSANPFLGGAVTTTPSGTTPSATLPFVAAVSSVSPGPIDMSYMPENTEYLMYVRPADMLKSGFVQPLTQTPQFTQAMDQMTAQFKFTPSDIDSVTFGMSNLVATLTPVIFQAQSGTQPDPAALSQKLMGGENAAFVIRTVADVDISSLLQSAGATEGTQEGKTYHLLQNPDPSQPQMAVHAVDAKTFVFASEPGIKAIITNGQGEATREEFAFLSRDSHMIQAFSSPLLAGMSGSIPEPPPEAPPQVAQFLEAVKGNITGGAIVLAAGSDLKLDVSLNLTEASLAGDANQALDGGLVMLKQAAPFMLGSAPPELQPALKQIVESLTASSSANAVTVSVNVPGSLVQTLKDNPSLLGPIAAAQNAAAKPVQKNNLKQIALAMLNFHDTHNHFPASNGNGDTGPTKSTGLSWRVHILPFIEQVELYQQFHLDEPWDSDHNKTLIPLMPDTYKVEGVFEPGKTSIHVFAAANSPFDPDKPVSMRDITDGTSNTIMAVAAGPDTAVPWTEPGGLPFDMSDPIAALGAIGDSFEAVLCDGSTRTISALLDSEVLNRLIQHNDGNPVNF